MPGERNKRTQELEARVEFYSGYRIGETPRSVQLGEEKLVITEILSRERHVDPGTGEFRDVFVCKAGSRKLEIILHASGKTDVAISS